MHVSIAKMLTEEIERKIRDFRSTTACIHITPNVRSEFQNDIRKRNEETVRKSHRNKLAALDKHSKLRKTYELRCKEAEKLGDEANLVQSMPVPVSSEHCSCGASRRRQRKCVCG